MMATNRDSTTLAADILVVDDTVESLKLLTEILARAGYRVRPAEEPQLGLHSALAHPPSLILLDVRMPGMSGFELCRRLKQDERTRDIPVIFVSALQDVADRIQGFEAGGVDFVSKPFEESEVLARVKTHLQLRTLQLNLEHLVAERTAELTQTNKVLQTEITERMQVEETLRESEVRFRATFEQSAAGIAHVAPDGRFLRINQRFCNIVGYSQEELFTCTFQDITHPDDLNADLKHVQGLLAGEAEMYSVEKRYFRKEGEIVWVNLTVSLLREETGKPIYFISVVEDITNRIQAEQQIHKHQERLKALASRLAIAEEKERRRIAADLHDHVSLSLALARIQLGKARDMSSESRRNALIDDTLQTLMEAIQDTRTLIFELSSPLLNELGLETAVSAWLRDQIGAKYDLETKFLDDNQEKPLTEDVRAILFRNVRELLANIVRHAQASEIQVSLERQGADFVITIQDDGLGFDPGSVFKQVHPKGGFGLFSIQERMVDLGGSFEISSTPGKGCTAVLTAPLELE